MSYLIDSDVVIDALVAQPAIVVLMRDLRRSGVAISVISLIEVLEGVGGAQPPQLACTPLRAFLRGTKLHIVSRQIAQRADDIRVGLRAAKRPVNERARHPHHRDGDRA